MNHCDSRRVPQLSTVVATHCEHFWTLFLHCSLRVTANCCVGMIVPPWNSPYTSLIPWINNEDSVVCSRHIGCPPPTPNTFRLFRRNLLVSACMDLCNSATVALPQDAAAHGCHYRSTQLLIVRFSTNPVSAKHCL